MLVEEICALALAGVYASLVTRTGIPALRQDWGWPASAAQSDHFLVSAWTGWSTAGLGAPSAYPTGYLLSIPLTVCLRAVGPGAALFLFLLTVGIVVSFGALSIVRLRTHRLATSMGLMAFALFNPWVYTKTVAGHAIMVLAYGLTMFLVSALCAATLSWRKLALILIAAFAQLQFFVVALAITILQIRRSGTLRALLVAAIIALSTIVGVLANWNTLRAAPYTLAWQQNESVSPGRVLLLMGYFAGYAKPLAGWAEASCYLIIACAMLGLASAWCGAASDRRVSLVVLAAVITAATVATGTKGIIAQPYAYVVQRYPETALFRELYDLLGYVAIGYVTLASYAGRKRLLSALALCAGTAALGAWIAFPPTRFFVPSAALPVAHLVAPANTRFALYPAFQPLKFGGRGSGMDPDAHSRPGNVTPLNTYLIEYPAAVALTAYLRYGATTGLSGLSVSTIVTRAYLASNYGSLAAQLGGDFPRPGARAPARLKRIAYVPELSLLGTPQVAAIASTLGAGNVFFGDARHSGAIYTWRRLPRFWPVTAPNTHVSVRHGWVAAPFTFLAHLKAAQWLGGAATSSSDAVLRLPASRSLLVYVAGGSLRYRGRLVSRQTSGYRWVPVPHIPLALQCIGFCVVAGRASRLPSMPNNPPAHAYRAVPFKLLLPWLVVARVPPHARGALRYNVAYNRWWFAFLAGRRLQHLRLDETVNGWLVGGASRSKPLVVIEIVAALQALLELLGTLAVAWLLWACVSARIRTFHLPTQPQD